MQTRRFETPHGLTLAADIAGPKNGPPIVLLHGGGQTRGSWKNGLAALARAGNYVVSLDLRGHGESGWASDGNYTLAAMAEDLRAVLAQLPPRPVLVGASLGGLTALLALEAGKPPLARALILVDVTPRIDQAGSARIGAFMTANPDGFASLEEVADAIGAYNPHRPRPKDLSGLMRNLRERDGRFYWHWDPAFIQGRRADPEGFREELERNAAALTIPTMLVRGVQSDIVGEKEVAHFRQIMPRAEYVDVQGAGHMVAGDKNDAFNAAILDFIARVDASATA